MLLNSALVVLASTAASAKLWGWPDTFTISYDDYNRNKMRACDGWGNWCDDGACKPMQHFDCAPNSEHALHRLPQYWSWGTFRKEGSAWLDVWRQGDSHTFNMYESNQNGTVHGQCQAVDFALDIHECGHKKTNVILNCWQW